MATDPISPSPAAPPSIPEGYRLSEVTIHLTRSVAGGSPLPRNITFSLDGGRQIEAGQRRINQPLTPKELMQLLDGLYRLRLFALPEDWTVVEGVGLDAHGVVRRRALSPADADWTRICLRTGKSEKCVRFSDAGPSDLANWASTQFTEAAGRL